MIDADSLLAPGFLGRWLAGEAGEGATGKRGFVGVAGSNMDDDLLPWVRLCGAVILLSRKPAESCNGVKATLHRFKNCSAGRCRSQPATKASQPPKPDGDWSD